MKTQEVRKNRQKRRRNKKQGEKSFTMLSKNNTPSAKAFAEQRYRKADSLTECRQSEKHIEPDKGGYCQVTEKTD